MKQFISGCLATLAVVLVGFNDADAPKESEKPAWRYRTEMVKHTIFQPGTEVLDKVNADLAGIGLALRISKSIQKLEESSGEGWRLAHVVQKGDWLALVFENQYIPSSNSDDKNEADSPTKQN